MGKNRKIKKRIEGLKRTREEHLQKIEDYDGENEYLVPYWEREIEDIDQKISDKKRRLDK